MTKSSSPVARVNSAKTLVPVPVARTELLPSSRTISRSTAAQNFDLDCSARGNRHGAVAQRPLFGRGFGARSLTLRTSVFIRTSLRRRFSKSFAVSK